MYGPEFLVCSACDVRLALPGATGDPDADSRWSLVELRSAPLVWIERLQEELTRARIFHRTVVSAADPRELSIKVRRDDLERAMRIDRMVYETEVPEAAGTPPVDGIDPSRCPGCGGALSDSDRECTGCGLTFETPPGWSCAACGSPLTEGNGTCPRCGAGIEWSGR